jgi:hypothetical protein
MRSDEDEDRLDLGWKGERSASVGSVHGGGTSASMRAEIEALIRALTPLGEPFQPLHRS